MVLQRAGHDLGRGGRRTVDQHDHWLALGQIASLRVEDLRFLGIAAAGGDDLAALQEGVGDQHRLVETAAAIIAEVDDIALDLVDADLGIDLLDALAQALIGLLAEGADADIADIALDALLNRGNDDVRAGERELQRLGLARTLDL